MKAEYRITYTFTNEETGESKDIAIQVQEIDDDRARQVGWLRLSLENQLNYRTARNLWSRTRTKYAYANKPWDEWDELEQFLLNIEGVSQALYNDPYMGAYGPPKYVLSISNDYETSEIKDKITEYYDGFAFSSRQNKLEVIISPSA